MKNRKRSTPKDALWVVDYIDRLNPSESFSSKPMPHDQAEAEYNQFTDDNTVKTSKDKNAMGYYQLRQIPLENR